MKISQTEMAHNTTEDTPPRVPDKSNNRSKRSNINPPPGKTNTARPTFYFFKTSSDPVRSTGAVLDSGVVTSIVVKTTLDLSLRALTINDVPHGTPARESHPVGNHNESHKTICAVKFPFRDKDESGSSGGEVNIQFDVIDGSLPFVTGLPSLLAMKANINVK